MPADCCGLSGRRAHGQRTWRRLAAGPVKAAVHDHVDGAAALGSRAFAAIDRLRRSLSACATSARCGSARIRRCCAPGRMPGCWADSSSPRSQLRRIRRTTLHEPFSVIVDPRRRSRCIVLPGSGPQARRWKRWRFALRRAYRRFRERLLRDDDAQHTRSCSRRDLGDVRLTRPAGFRRDTAHRSAGGVLLRETLDARRPFPTRRKAALRRVDRRGVSEHRRGRGVHQRRQAMQAYHSRLRRVCTIRYATWIQQAALSCTGFSICLRRRHSRRASIGRL